jgi:GT2 family glycosyltransferase/thymidylate kinase
MGNDGSGKTTIARKLADIFEKAGLKVLYKHEYDYMFLKKLFKLVGERRVERARKEMISERKRSWKYYVWPLFVWFDVFVQYIYFKFFKRKAIIIFDRYVYDHYLSFKYLGYLTKIAEWMYLHFPKPDVGVILWVNPEIAYARKKATHHYPLEFYIIQGNRYLELAKKLKLPVVNTGKDINQTITEILRLIVSSLYQKGKYNILAKLINLRLCSNRTHVSKVSVIIPTYKRNDKLAILLKSLKGQRLDKSIQLEIIVVDDSENKAALEILDKFKTEDNSNQITIKYLWSGGNRYPSYCRNLGAKHSKGDILVFIDDDNLLSSNTIQTLVKYFNKYPFFGLLGIINYDKKGRIWSVGGRLLKTPFTIVLYNINNYNLNTCINDICLVDYIPNIYAIPKCIFNEIGGFNEIFFPQALEEVDLALRVWKAGFMVGIIVDSNAYTIHLFENNRRKPSRPSRYYLRGRNRMLFYYKHFKHLLLWNGLPDILLRSVKVMIYNVPWSVKKLLIRSYILGIRDGLRIIKRYTK